MNANKGHMGHKVLTSLLLMVMFHFGMGKYPLPLTEDPTSLNYGIKFIENKHIYFSSDVWTHTFKIEMPNNHIFTDIDICTKEVKFSLQLGCSLGQEINTLRVNLENNLKQVLNTFEQIVPLIDIQDISKRAVLSFVGDIYGSLFGIATKKDVKKLAHHINLLVKSMNNITETFSNSQGNFASFVKHTNNEFLNFEEFMNNSEAIKETIFQTISAEDDKHKSIEKVIVFFTNQAAKIRTHFSNLMIALNLLNNKRISPYLIPYNILQQAISNITNLLDTEYPNYKLVTTDVSFYYRYDQYIFGRWRNSLFLTLKFPITSHFKFDSYNVKIFHLPINAVDLNDKNANILINAPEYFALSETDQLFTTFSNDFMTSCTNHINFILCENKLVFQTFETENCYLQLFRNNNPREISKLCKYNLERKVIKPEFHLLDNSQVLIYHIAKYNISCINETTKELSGCIFCIKHIPCGCTIYTEFQRVLSHKTLCDKEINIQTIFPINIPLIQHFFNDTTIDKILKNLSLHEPLKVNIPKLRVFEKNTKSLIAGSIKERLSLEKVARQAKLNQKVYTSLAESILDGEVPINTGLKTIDILAIIGILITVLNSLLIILICNKLRTLTAVFMLIRTARAMETLSYDQVTVKSFDLLQEIKDTISYEHVLTFLMIFHILLALLSLYKLNVFKRKRLTTLDLHMSNGIRCIDIRLLIIESCFIEWIINIPPELTIYNVEGVFRPKLHLDTRALEVRNRITNQVLLVPAILDLSYWQAWQIRKLLRTTYFSKIYLNHNGKLIKISSNNETNRLC